MGILSDDRFGVLDDEDTDTYYDGGEVSGTYYNDDELEDDISY